jgi:hypothetical protein
MGKDVKLINENTLFNVHLGREEKETWSNLYRDTEYMFYLWQHRQIFVQGMFGMSWLLKLSDSVSTTHHSNFFDFAKEIIIKISSKFKEIHE